jgi:citrate synthase
LLIVNLDYKNQHVTRFSDQDASPGLLTAEEAARRLRFSRATLYAYVSRGILRAHAADDPRERRYSAEAVEQLAEQRKRGRKPKEIARATLNFGVPVLESGITAIKGGRLYYRGRDAVTLAQSASLEEAAALLWRAPRDAAFPEHALAFAGDLPSVAREKLAENLLSRFASATVDEPTAAWLPHEQVFAGCGNLVRVMGALVAGAQAPEAAPIHRQVAKTYGLDLEAAELLRMALVLCADHELNASSFAARVVASTGASLRAAAIAGLAALSGPKHGGLTWRVEALFDAVGDDDPGPVLLKRLAAGEDLPGFGHPLYPEGDPRAAALLFPTSPRHAQARAIAEAAERLTGRLPSLDFALVALRRRLGLPRGLAFCLFALGRTVGWIAHGLEQREQGGLIRPRAVYTGPPP